LDPRPEFRYRGILVDARNRRRGELHGLRDTDPSLLISMYRRAAALNDDRPLPSGVTFVGIVEAILDEEILTAAIPDESF
jgi:hypothetical protein